MKFMQKLSAHENFSLVILKEQVDGTYTYLRACVAERFQRAWHGLISNRQIFNLFKFLHPYYSPLKIFHVF